MEPAIARQLPFHCARPMPQPASLPATPVQPAGWGFALPLPVLFCWLQPRCDLVLPVAITLSVQGKGAQEPPPAAANNNLSASEAAALRSMVAILAQQQAGLSAALQVRRPGSCGAHAAQCLAAPKRQQRRRAIVKQLAGAEAALSPCCAEARCAALACRMSGSARLHWRRGWQPWSRRLWRAAVLRLGAAPAAARPPAAWRWAQPPRSVPAQGEAWALRCRCWPSCPTYICHTCVN